ncbi:hypothetical protein FOQG_07309 [Fusarium oxysporum f. sp. raphani 54005]|uniref:Uncharacterized protein n=4 Tax=Fusarium oxysporum TaxID=5507 RepID=X0CG39_FUSOX|nr:hypothetical protein FOWG_07290 [Fusarium oxysporum f. sp. lycopersici MN25]EXA53214.1 hypothetical protein FOVG_01148 [Fusarium oxysporum f. sp. pisi HDV247]EXK89784.1 hypothetical protein FOQG_07309 [Fusarium oxysporum f. sp. raphani 54005]EXL49506.1 hypothetical protein FOCG_09836 [Fusarium oxysporum f. sp. radicis-lycopersici 26381]EXL80731.1 hypothetical protein FOPG_05739 [Fusarium oxysporum f. sp. conglutinans race 2 54008]EXM24325.1 hypothetical protein FOTG_08756 [Fusarium oxysporu
MVHNISTLGSNGQGNAGVRRICRVFQSGSATETVRTRVKAIRLRFVAGR